MNEWNYLIRSHNMTEDRKKNIIVMVDDDVDLETIVSIKLQSVGFDVRTTTIPQKGLEMVEEIHPDLVLLDVNMPGMNGLEFLAELQNHVQLKNIKLVLFSSMMNDWSNDEHKQEMLRKLGAFASLDKAIDLDQLVKKLKDMIEAPSKEE